MLKALSRKSFSLRKGERWRKREREREKGERKRERKRDGERNGEEESDGKIFFSIIFFNCSP